MIILLMSTILSIYFWRHPEQKQIAMSKIKSQGSKILVGMAIIILLTIGLPIKI